MKQKRIIFLLAVLLLGCSMGGTEKQSEATEQPADSPAETSEPEVRDPALNPFFTCMGTEYGAYPILPPEKREAEAKEFLAENREFLELAAVALLNKPDLKIYSGEAHMPNAEGWYEPIDAATLPESLQALVALSEKTGIPVWGTCGTQRVLDAFDAYAKEHGLDPRYIGQYQPIEVLMHRSWDKFLSEGL